MLREQRTDSQTAEAEVSKEGRNVGLLSHQEHGKPSSGVLEDADFNHMDSVMCQGSREIVGQRSE